MVSRADKRKYLDEAKGGKLEAAIRKVFPSWGAARMKSRLETAKASFAYTAANKAKATISGWNWSSGDADSELLADLETLRGEARDLSRNSTIGRAAVNTNVTNIVGTGLNPQPQVDRNVLSLSDEQADALEAIIKREWLLWADSTACDIEREQNFSKILSLALRSALDSGDVFAITPVTERPETPYGTRIQLIEADRVSNPNNIMDTDLLAGGIEKNELGEPVKVHVMVGHPGNPLTETSKWESINYHGADGRKNVIHLYPKERIGQRRGIPYLAPVIESLKQLQRYTESELHAAVVSSFFTVFVKSNSGDGLNAMDSIGGSSADSDYKMGSGNILDLGEGEDVTFADPNRPNKGYEAFAQAISKQIGAALEIPEEILMKMFTKSYSASRASMLEAWRYFLSRRKWVVDQFCKPIYETWFYEAVAIGRIPAPGFLTGGPEIRQAYLGARWVGPPRGMIDEVKEVEGAEKRMEAGLSSLEDEAAALTGNDWEKTHAQRVKEVTKRREAGLEIDITQIQEFRR